MALTFLSIPFSTPCQIHGAEPEDVTPGFEQRLAEAIAAQGRGMELEAVYLRRGCIELVGAAGRGRGAGGRVCGEVMGWVGVG